jgi:hypothetical protein
MTCTSCAHWTNETLCKDRMGIDPNYPCIHYHPVSSAVATENKCGMGDSKGIPNPKGKEENEGKKTSGLTEGGNSWKGAALSISDWKLLSAENERLRFALERACNWIAKHHGCPVDAMRYRAST